MAFATTFSITGKSLLVSKVGLRPKRTRLTIQAAVAVPSQYKNVTPVGDRVFVKIDIEQPKTAGGILLPTTSLAKPTTGSVVSAGEAKDVKVGDHVIYSKYAGTEVKLDDTDYMLLKEADVIGTIPSGKISQLKPLGDRVLIEVASAEEQSAGGILLTSEAAQKPTLGKVVAVGEGSVDDKGKRTKPNVEVGATVLYSKYSGSEFDDEDSGSKYVVVKDADILASLG